MSRRFSPPKFVGHDNTYSARHCTFHDVPNQQEPLVTEDHGWQIKQMLRSSGPSARNSLSNFPPATVPHHPDTQAVSAR